MLRGGLSWKLTLVSSLYNVVIVWSLVILEIKILTVNLFLNLYPELMQRTFQIFNFTTCFVCFLTILIVMQGATKNDLVLFVIDTFFWKFAFISSIIITTFLTIRT